MTGAEAMPQRRKMPSWLPQVIGYAISVGCLAWVLHGYPFDQIIPAIKDLDWKWVAVSVAADLSVYIVHAWRWNTLLSPVARLKLWRTAQAIYIGLFANEVLPLRVGELIRCYLLAHWNGLRLTMGFSSAAIERLIDGFWMLSAFLITFHFVSDTPGGKTIPKDLKFLVDLIGVLLVVGACVLLWILTRKPESHAVAAEGRVSATLRHIVEGLRLMGNPRTLILTALISLLYLALHIFSLYALLKAYKTDYSFWVAAGAVTIIRFATVVPNAPGNLGVINIACVIALKVFDLPENDAKTFSILLFGAWTLPLLIGGAVATALTGVNIGELRDRARQGVRSENTAPRQPGTTLN